VSFAKILYAALLASSLTLNAGKGGEIASSEASPVIIYNANGVVISRASNGSELAIDNSGHGAVMCVWSFYVGLAAYLDICFPDKDKEFREDLGKGIDKIDQFIVENSLIPVSKADLEARERSVRTRFSEASPSEIQTTCSASPGDNRYGVYASFRSALTNEKLKASIADLLSVPRPRVMNPCL
jgi:hypothetical protein